MYKSVVTLKREKVDPVSYLCNVTITLSDATSWDDDDDDTVN